jgi:hypothetical protein
MALEGKSAEEVQALATLADSIASNPKTRTAFQRLLKQANPEISIPEIEIEDRIASVTKPYVEKLEKLEARDAQAESQAAANALYEGLRDDRVVTNRAGFSELVKYASEQGFQTTEAGLRMAASHRASEQEAAEPTPMPNGGIDLSQHEANKDLMRDPRGWANAQARAAIDEMAKQRQQQRR